MRREGGLYTEAKPMAVKLSTASLKTPPPGDGTSQGLTFVAFAHIFLYDGRGADKPWLQEIPEPVTQIVWDSWAEIHPTTAAKLGIAKDELIELRTEHGAIEAPALISAKRASRRDRRSSRPGASRIRPLRERCRREPLEDPRRGLATNRGVGKAAPGAAAGSSRRWARAICSDARSSRR